MKSGPCLVEPSRLQIGIASCVLTGLGVFCESSNLYKRTGALQYHVGKVRLGSHLRKDTVPHALAKAWLIDYTRHIIRAQHYKGKRIEKEDCPVRLAFNAASFPGFVLMAAWLHCSVFVMCQILMLRLQPKILRRPLYCKFAAANPSTKKQLWKPSTSSS